MQQEESLSSANPVSNQVAMKEQAAGAVSTRNPTADAMMEVQTYLEEALLPKSSNHLKWGGNQPTVYPRLTKLVVERLCRDPTSAQHYL